MYPQQLTSHAKLLSAITLAAGVAAQTTINGSIIDMQGFDGVLFMLNIGAITTGGVQSVKLQHGDQAGGGDMADVLGSAQTIADSEDNTVRFLEMTKPSKRYCRIVVSRATQDSAFAASALPYHKWDGPVTQTALGESMNNPVSGTA